ncbi:transposable element Tc3 transposase [Trichonephila clavipes]|uniref:Transposable element Tc3 transposase n=1 Tax=Trichonephila clavipes TaxID=2585209 RepID=A0A8X6SDV2_TRICX|nr:transposable element Tc3 transposase [Trichonephila clavipes]
MSSNTCCSGLSRQRGYSTSRMASVWLVFSRFSYGSYSPDLNPVENVWDALGRQVAGRNYPPTNKNTLIRALTEEWDKLPQQLLDNVVQSMARRVECCITLHGGHIPY